MADYFVLSTARNDRQARAIADAIAEKLGPAYSVEGMTSAHWILLDYGDVVFHVFQEEARRFYALERLWGDAANETGVLQPRGAQRPTRRREQAAALAASHGEKESPGRLRSHFKTRNRALAREIASIERAADLPSTILILGESGTGKDRLARAIHDVSVARREPVRPGGRGEPLRRALRERALRPRARRLHRRVRRQEGPARGRRGRARSISTRSLRCRRRPRPSSCACSRRRTSAGSPASTTHPFRARLIVSSRRDLAGLVEQGAFRDDFFYRIDVVSIRLPPPGRPPRGHPPARPRVSPRAPRARTSGPARRSRRRPSSTLLRHPWPGNVRELLHVVEKAVLTAEAAEIGPADLPAGSARGARIAACVRRREALDTAGADGRVHRRNTPPRRRKPVAGREAAGRLAQVPVGKGEEIGRFSRLKPALSDGIRWTSARGSVIIARSKNRP